MKNKAKLGAIVGGIEGIIYSILFLLALELYLPHPNPPKIVILDIDNLFTNVLSISFGTVSSALIGSFSIVIFNTILKRFRLQKNNFVAICVLFSITLAFPVNYLFFNSYYFESVENSLLYIRSDWHLFQSFLFLIAIITLPSLIYVGTSLFISNYLYDKQFSN